MFTVTLHYDDCPGLAPSIVHQCETYAEAYRWAQSAAKSLTVRGGGYITTVHDDETWMDRIEARRRYSPTNALIGRAEITCDDLDAWHARVLASEFQSVFSC